MVAEWVDAWAPVILAAHAETEWPETLVLDSTEFLWTNSRTGIRRREFAILVAYGYTGPAVGRVEWSAGSADRDAIAAVIAELLTVTDLAGGARRGGRHVGCFRRRLPS